MRSTSKTDSPSQGGEEVFFRFEPRNSAQERAVAAYRESDVLFLIGASGSGKTSTAIGLALQDLIAKRANRVVVTRPLVEAGEVLGILPGTLEEKIAPWLVPVDDALSGQTRHTKQLMSRVQFVPIAVARGRTFADSVTLLDEAQNCTYTQFKLILSRLGRPSRGCVSKIIVTADPDQIDLPPGRSGLSQVLAKLSDLPGVSVVHFEKGDNLRHPLVSAMMSRLEGTESSPH